MSENTLLFVCIGGIIVLAAAIILLGNYLSDRSNKRRAQKMQQDIENGTYDKNKKYMGNQGGWETDGTSDTTNAPPL